MIFLVAEIGVNWDGDLTLAKEMMQTAKDAGCNAVKFQAFEEKTVENHPESSRLIKSSISKSNIEFIDEISKAIGIEWFCTPMYPDAVDFLNPFVSRFKIREFDSRPLLENHTTPLIEKILKTGKEVIISSQKSPINSKYYKNKQIKWLYCVPKYPCNLEELDFQNFKDFHGLSNHCNQLIGPISAAVLGAKIIEVHMTSDKTKPFLDNQVSFDYKELVELLKQIRLSEKIKK